MATQSYIRDVLEYIERGQDELAELLSELITIPSVFPSGAYDEIAARMQREFLSAGADVKLISAPRERVEALGLSYPRPNVVAQIGSGRGPVLLIGTHMDVVEPGDQQAWSHPPFSGAVADGNIWGRGSCDAKAALAAQIFVARTIGDLGFTLGGTLLLAGSIDDEGGHDQLNWPGMTYLAEEGLKAHGFPEPDMVINGEASGLDQICGSFKGRLVAEIAVRGDTAHASTDHGTNAIDQALLLIERLRTLPLQAHPVQGQETLTVCSIIGGAARYSDVPDTCRIGIDVRAVPPRGTAGIREKLDAVLADLEAAHPAFHVDGIRYLSEREPIEVPRDHPLVEALESAAAAIGISAEYAAILGTGDLQAFVERGLGGVTYGPGSISRVHRPDEYVEIEALVQQTQMYALAALDLCQASR